LSAKRDVVDLFTKSAGVSNHASSNSPALIAALGWDAQVGHFASPYSAGSAYVLLHHVLGETNGKPGVWGHAIGGMGAITQAMAAEARLRGVEIFTGSPVARVNVQQAGGRVRVDGLTLADGRVVPARTVAANVHPKLLYQRLVPRDALDAADADFAQRIDRHANGSGTLRMNLALDALPNFTAASGHHAQAHHGAGIVIAPSLKYMETAYAQARAQGIPEAPIVELLLPSTLDDSLAPPGKHVATLFCQHFNPALDWDTHKAAAAQKVLDTVEAVAPGFKQSILAQDVLTPLDLEREYGLIGGDIFHGRLTLDQLFAARPVLGAANYRQPIKGLYLCGAGAHPGGGVTGAPGHNAAQVILKTLRAIG
jgi:phytoene dehydrogenase-like protein